MTKEKKYKPEKEFNFSVSVGSNKVGEFTSPLNEIMIIAQAKDILKEHLVDLEKGKYVDINNIHVTIHKTTKFGLAYANLYPFFSKSNSILQIDFIAKTYHV